MAVKAVEMVRKIRDKQFEETKGISVEEQIEFIRKKSEELQKSLQGVSVQLQITQHKRQRSKLLRNFICAGTVMRQGK